MFVSLLAVERFLQAEPLVINFISLANNVSKSAAASIVEEPSGSAFLAVLIHKIVEVAVCCSIGASSVTQFFSLGTTS